MDEHLIKSDKEDKEEIPMPETEGQIFYLKMKGDYLRYKAEVASNDSDERKGEYCQLGAI